MRITLISPFSKDQVNLSAATRLIRLLGGLHDFCLILLARSGPPVSDLIHGLDARLKVHVVLGGQGLDWGAAQKLAALVREEHAHVVHAHGYKAFLQCLAARQLYRRAPVLFTEHFRRYPDLPNRRRIVVSRMLLKGRDRVVSASYSIRRALIDNEGLPPDRIDVIYDGIGTPTATAANPADRRRVRGEIGIGDDDLLIFQDAPLESRSDHLLALQAMERVVPSRPDAKLVMVGMGSEMASIREAARRRGLGPNIRLLGRRGDVAGLTAAADVVLRTSLGEEPTRPLLGGMAAARPVVATRSGSVGELVLDGDSGILAGPGDYAALARGILELGGNPSLREEMGRRARERAETLFSESAMASSYDETYRKMAEGA